MGNVYAEITLRNVGDLMMARNGYLEKNNIRETVVKAMVDTGAWTLVIGDEIREKLGLELRGEDWVTLANGETETAKITDPVEVQWKNRTMTCQPILIPRADEVLLGAIPLEDMDLIVDPRKEELTGRHGESIIRRL